MKKGCLLIILALLVILGEYASAEQDPKEVLKAIVKIRSTVPADAHSARTLGTEREGSGVVIDSQGHILTIGYLILEAETITVLELEEKPISATWVGYDHITGFGLLRADKPLSVKPMELGQSAEVKEGDPVLIASHGGAESVQGARVLSRKDFVGYWEYLLEEAIFTSPPHANFGGAALIDRNRKLVGIGSLFTQLTVPGIGAIPCNMSVPIDYLKPILNDLINKGRAATPPRPWLGLYSEETHGRIIVSRVTPGSPAEQAGLHPGDVILTVDKKAVNGLADFYRKIWALGKAGIEVPLSVLQGIQIRDLSVKSIDRYQFYRPKGQKRANKSGGDGEKIKNSTEIVI